MRTLSPNSIGPSPRGGVRIGSDTRPLHGYSWVDPSRRILRMSRQIVQLDPPKNRSPDDPCKPHTAQREASGFTRPLEDTHFATTTQSSERIGSGPSQSLGCSAFSLPLRVPSKRVAGNFDQGQGR